MLCSKCKKRPAVVFISNSKEDTSAQGLCLTCARAMGIKPIDNLIQSMGISSDDLEAMSEQLQGLIPLPDDEGDVDEYADFAQGGATTFPFLRNIFSKTFNDANQNNGNDEKKNKKSNKESKNKYIDTYCCNLTKKARDGELDNVIGRDREIDRVIQILSRRTKNNPCLIGEPGVGKTAIAEAIAIKIAKKDVPIRLQDKQLHLLDLTALVAGTQFRGQFESRIKGLIKEIKEAKNIILFIDEVHGLVGTGDSEGLNNAANLLKPALSRGEIQVIGATTFAEYRKYIEKDSALERRFQRVTVLEPSINDTVDLLNGIKFYYEAFHRVKVTDKAIKKIVTLSERYITDRFLPDKAIDLLDESCAYAALSNKHLSEYDMLSSEMSKSIEEEKRLTSSPAEEIDYEKLAKVRCEIAKAGEQLNKIQDEAIGKEVEEEHIAHVIELWTGIPSSRIKESELKKLADIESKLKKHIIGQDEGVSVLSAAIKRSRVQISPRRRPASFIFVGPTGVGKTELVKVLSTELFDTPETLIRLDMSEFMEKHAISRIIGAPPGYVGYDEAGQVTEKVRRQPYSILLLDEIEKAHPDVMNLLLQILDEGKINDAQGRTVNFENTVIIMTSNAGSDKKDSALGFAKSQDDLSKERAMKALREFLRPEFLSRIDEIVMFKNLTEDDFEKIARIMLDEYVESLKEKSIAFSYNDDVPQLLARKSIGGKSGARDLRNLIRREVEDKISAAFIENLSFDIGSILLTVEKNDLKLLIA